MIGFLLLLITAALVYYLVIKPNRYWPQKNVQAGVVIPMFGDLFYLVTGIDNLIQFIQRLYNKVPNVRYLGGFQFNLPILCLKCPELIKQMCVKDFDHFLNHRSLLPDEVDILLSKNLLALKGQKWKDMRSTLSPTFTSSKMKSMFTLMTNNARSFAQHFVEKEKDLVEVEMKDAYTRYANDVIASCAFGIQVDSLGNRENEFYTMGRQVNFSSPLTKLVFFLYQCFPKMAKFIGIPIFSEKLRMFFINLVNDTIKIREEQNIKRPDMLGLLIDARKGQEDVKSEVTEEASFAVVEEHLEGKHVKGNLTDIDIASQVFVFFLGGFETVSTAMCFVAYELALNPDVQQKLIDEIDEKRSQNEEISYEQIINMTYLDMVISETLRKWPSVMAVDREVTKPYTIQPTLPHEKAVHLEVGDIIIIPTYSIHHDERYYENPEKFDPERFSPENRKNILPYTYIPFGVGPRNCIGSRFALLEIKALFYYLLSSFEIAPTKNTNIPLKISKSGLGLESVNGFPLELKKRKKGVFEQ